MTCEFACFYLKCEGFFGFAKASCLEVFLVSCQFLVPSLHVAGKLQESGVHFLSLTLHIDCMRLINKSPGFSKERGQPEDSLAYMTEISMRIR
jgi:hypothetical protein